MIRKSYSFAAKGKCRVSGLGIEARCIYFDSRRPVSELEFFDELDVSLAESDTLPDCVVVLASPALAAALRSYWCGSFAQRETFIERGARKGVQYVKDYSFFSWGAQDITKLRDSADHPVKGAFEVPIESFVRQGLRELIRENPVVQLAPAGHVFQHPSGTVNKVFIQTRELVKSEPELAFVGHGLCMAVKQILLQELAVVYVDTMSIYSFVREALKVAGVEARIYSYHSYGELSKLSPPIEPYLVVISASTTGGMARRLHEEQDFDAQRLVTMIDVSSEGRSGIVLIALEEVDESYNKELADGTETEIELVGEHFSSKAKPPRAVTLGQPHTPRDLTALLRHFGIRGVTHINEAAGGSGRPRTVHLNAEALDSITNFHKWLETEIRWSVSIAVDRVVCTSDPGSRAIAKRAANILQQARGSSSCPIVVPYDALDTRSLIDATGLLIVTAVAGDGGVLREISRDLRELVKPELPRHFLVGVGLPQSDEAWTKLRQFLERNTTPRRYGFSSWLALPVGPDGGNNAWEDFSKLASEAQLEFPRRLLPSGVAEASLKELSEIVGAAYNGFLPQSNGSPLGLSDGFLFFGDVFNGHSLTDIPCATTNLAVAAVLQAARDLSNASNQLRPTGYESVVLSPENFLRFNDNLLQACLLRSAHPSELDYSASPHMSTLMKEFVHKVLARHGHPYGAAALEFAAALATGRLKLKKADLQEVVNSAIEKLKGEPSALLGFLLMVKT